MDDWVQPTSRGELPRREVMQTPDEVAAMLRLKALGWGVRRIAGELGCSHMTVRRYLSEGGWVAYRGRGRPRTLSGLEEWVAERFRRHAGNADVVRQELEREKGIRLTLRTVEREVRHLRRELESEARATIRFETPPGKQLQIDFGERRAMIGDENVKVYLFVATLVYSRRLYVRPFRNERQESWFAGVEGAFRHFGGVTEEVLLDNDRGLVVRHDRVTREVEFNAQRVHGTTGEAPIERFRRAEAGALRSITEVRPFELARELVRKVQADCVIEVDSNAYSVPWRLIGETVRGVIAGDLLRLSHAGREGAVYHRRTGRFERVVDPVHFDGVVGFGSKARLASVPTPEPIGADELLRPLLEYERVVGGRW